MTKISDPWENMHRYIENKMNPEEEADFRRQLTEDTTLAKDWEFFQIEQYLDGKLNGKWKAGFEKQVNSQPGLKSELEWHRQQQALIKVSSNLEVREELKQLLPRQKVKAKIRPLRKRLYWTAAAASVILLLSVLYAYLYRPPGNEQLYAMYYEPYPMILSARGENPEQKLLNEALTAYLEGNYSRALSGFKNQMHEDSLRSVYRLYAGISALETGRFQEAISQLEALQNDETFSEPAAWYLGLYYLKSGNQDRAMSLLQQIESQKEHRYREPARRLLKQLE